MSAPSREGHTAGMLQAALLLYAARDGKHGIHVTSRPAIAWEQLKYAAGSLGFAARFNETHRAVFLDDRGGSVRIVAPTDERTLRGRAIDAAVVDQRSELVDRVLLPRMAESGGWTIYVDEALS